MCPSPADDAVAHVDALSLTDWPAAATIYREGLADGDATFETAVPEASAFFAKTIDGCRLAARPAPGSAQLLGWAALSRTSPRAVYAGVAEISVYVAGSARGRGVGRALLEALTEAAERAGLWTLTAGVFPENSASVRLHLGCGFRVVGRREGVGRHHGRFRDVLWLERAVGPRPRDEAAAVTTAAHLSGAAVTIRRATEADADAIWRIFHAVVAAGDSYPYPPDTPREQALSLWLAAPGARAYVAERDGRVVGTYVLKPNQPGLGGHVCNAGYMVAAEARGHGLGRAMCEHSLREARAAGFAAMQFNLVVATNITAVRLWQRLGFATVGVLPRAFRHRELGLVDALVMYRELD